MDAGPVVRRSVGAQELAERVTATLVSALSSIQDDGRIPSLVLTGGSIARLIHTSVATSPDRDLADWSRVDFWFGDERFVAADSRDRNAGQTQADLFDHVPVDPARVHPMPAFGEEYGADVDAAARGYLDELRGELPLDHDGPVFDILMLGIGPDGHCASLFPGHPALDASDFVVGVRSSPKPPPTRISMSMALLNRAREVWWVASGAEKAQAVADALTGDDVHQVPASGPKGLDRTIWYLDDAAASRLPVDP